MCCVDNRADVTVDMADTLNVHRGGAPLVVGIRVGVGGVVCEPKTMSECHRQYEICCE